ncbi:c-type cytochrome [Roseimarinus sediminis]|jgi:mono/diheme cytochrome c family protein|uniref:c-type cytochrome n=1 Tax=Roseimarinus sediminis TaxID=1610899 RepID=UPI003D190435
MKRLSAIMLSLVGVMFIISMSSFTPQVEGQKKGAAWDIPEKYQKMENPYADDKSLVNIGKGLYMKHCRSCHGNAGLGDGPKARNLDVFPGDFSSAEFQKQNDGTLYYQTIIGRDQMPNYESKIPDEEDRWAVIMYLRSLKK